MKHLVNLLLLLSAIITLSCSKDDNAPVIPVAPVTENLLETPATLRNATQLNIPDAIQNTGGCGSTVTATKVSSQITIDKEGKIVDPSKVTITLYLAHTWSGDVVAELISPSGQICALIKRIGSIQDDSCGKNCNFVATNALRFNSSNNAMMNIGTLQDNDVVPAGDYEPTYGNSIFPEEAFQISLQDFLLNKNIKGNWKIRVADYGVGDAGKLFEWRMTFEPGSVQ